MRKVVVLLIIASAAVMYNSCQKAAEKLTPKACFSYSPTTDIHVGDLVTFSSSCSTSATTFNWDFGDGGTSTDASPTHTYASAADFTIKLEVKDAAGLSNSTTQTITVAAPTIPPGNMHSGALTQNETWAEGVHEVTGTVTVDGFTLTIAPGAIIKFDPETSLEIGNGGGAAGATLIANGTADKSILFTSSSSTPAAGDWNSITFASGASSNSSMKFCKVQYGGGYADYTGEINIKGTKVTIENSVIELSKYNGIVVDADGSFKSLVLDSIRQTPTNPIQLYGSNAHTIGLNNVFVTETGILVTGNTYNQANATWNKLTCPYIIDGTLSIENTTLAKLNLAPGVIIEFTQGSQIDVGYGSNTFGALIAQGTNSDSIHFTSAAPAGSKTPGDWYGIQFYKGAGNNSILRHCVVEYGGGYANYVGEIYVEQSSVKLDSSTIRNSASFGVNFDNGGRFGSCMNNTISGNAEYPINIYANYAHTIGTGNSFDAPGILVTAETVNANVTWLKQNVPYILDGEIDVQSTSGNTLTIQAGTVIEFTQNSQLSVGYSGAGTLIAQGTVDAPILFTSAQPEGSKSAGDWYSIWFDSGTGSGSIMDHCTVSFGGGYADYTGDITIQGAIAGRPTISNCTITDSNAFGIYINNGDTPTLSNNTFTNNTLGDTN